MSKTPNPTDSTPLPHTVGVRNSRNTKSDRDPYTKGPRNKHWWRQVAADMSSAMKHELTIRTLKRRARMLDGRGVRGHRLGSLNHKRWSRPHTMASRRQNARTMKHGQVRMLETNKCRGGYWHSRRALKKWTAQNKFSKINSSCRSSATEIVSRKFGKVQRIFLIRSL